MDNIPTPEEQKVIDDLLGSLQEGMFDTLLTKAKAYAKKGLLTATVLAALMASPSLSSAQKAQIKDVAEDTTTAVAGKRVGSAVDGKIGEYTSKYKFPLDASDTIKLIKQVNGKEVTLDTKVVTRVHDVMINAATQAGVSMEQMKEWNKFVDWMRAEGYAGDSSMNHTKHSKEVFTAYKKINPNFWIQWGSKDQKSADVEKVQTALQNVRDVMIQQFMDGKMGITLSGRKMDRNNPSDVALVNSNYMPVVKHVSVQEDTLKLKSSNHYPSDADWYIGFTPDQETANESEYDPKTGKVVRDTSVGTRATFLQQWDTSSGGFLEGDDVKRDSGTYSFNLNNIFRAYAKKTD